MLGFVSQESEWPLTPEPRMISNRRPSTFGGRRNQASPRSSVDEKTFKSEQIQIERKTFRFALGENPRGRFLRITEAVGRWRDAVVIPLPGLEDFKEVLDRMVKHAKEITKKDG